MEYSPEACRVEDFLPIDLVDENYADEDYMNDGVPVRESEEDYSGEGNPSTEEAGSQKNYSLNHAYVQQLTELKRIIKIKIQRCKEKQEIISKRVKDLEKQSMNPLSRKNWYHVFGYPYFKDKNFFPCPINDDHRRKMLKNEIDYHKLRSIRRWTEADCLKLEEAVKANAIEKKSSHLMSQRGLVLEKLRDHETTEKEKAVLNDDLNRIQKEINKIKNLNPESLYGDINTQFDWMKITAEEFGELRSSEEVQAMWVLCRHPSINRKHWTQTENVALRDIAKRHKEQDWASIARELNTNRSEFQCVVQYQRKLNTDFINHWWTAEEDEMLKYLVDRCRVNHYIPWATVSMCMKNRTRQQVYNRWMFSINPSIKKGRFTVEEDCLILAGIKHFGLDATKIAELLPGRTSVQVSARYKMCLSRDGPLGQWSVEEDMRLLKLVETHGKKWNLLALEHFTTRSRSQIRHRYMYLEDWLSKNPDCSVSKAPRRDLGDHNRRNSNLWSTIQAALTLSKRQRKDDKDIDREDLELLKVIIESNEKPKRSNVIGRKKKTFTKADKLLYQLGKVCYILTPGRNKVFFTEEEFQKRESMVLKVLNGLQSHLAFPFDESVIDNDSAWNLSDKSILLRLKEKYDLEDYTASFGNGSNGARGIVNNEGFSERSSVSEVTSNSVVALPSSVPLYKPENNMNASFLEIFPGFIGNIVGFRTILLSRPNLRMWRASSANDSVAVPALRPSSQVLQERGAKCFSKEESAKLFSERLFSLFFWPTQLVRYPPDFDDTTFVQPNPSAEKMSPSSAPPRRKGKRRTMKQQARGKKLLMKERWKKIREEKSKSKSQTSHSSSQSGAKSKRRKVELDLM
ncbi:snRNA-activating protein complex subunit 4-like [Hetaerina americana]|uniref:snRNA-activating protein complex subunit 4-like n=1 Tax=Hetaerina americana TaxID=62018 RepID=UPI003A7F53D7